METPDFNQIALRITAAIAVLPISYEAAHALGTEAREVIRQAWNARGEADLQAIDVEAHRVHAEANRTGREDLVIETVKVIKALDR